MVIDFLQFLANFILAGFLLKMILIKLPPDSQFRAALAFIV